MPKDKDELDAKKKKKQVKKKALKKGEKPPEPIKWAEPFKKPPPDTLDLLRKAAEDASENIFPASIREDQCNPGVLPCLIKEVFFPPMAPNDVATLIESALVYQNDANYALAVRSLEQARDLWRQIENMQSKDDK